METEVKTISQMNAERRSECNYIGYTIEEMESRVENATPFEMVKYAMNLEERDWFSDAFDTVEYKAHEIDYALARGLEMPEKATYEARVKELHVQGAQMYKDFQNAFKEWFAGYLATLKEMNSELYDDVVRDGQGLIVNE